jgi:hypothetical protein
MKLKTILEGKGARKKMTCCSGHGKSFPAIPLIMIVIGVFWLLNDLGIITTGIPWFSIFIRDPYFK